MSCNRIQKLLYSSEYGELEDFVLLESPFAEITPNGEGIRQVQIALTPTKLILAQDIFDENTSAINSNNDDKISFETVAVSPDVDAEIESLELVSIIPINLVNLSLFVRGRKRALKARLCNGRVCYFELGGLRHRKMLWNLWSEKVKCLSPGAPFSSCSDTSTTNSSSHTKICLHNNNSSTTSYHKNKLRYKYPGDKQKLRSEKSKPPARRKPWTDRNLFPSELDDDGRGEFCKKHQPSKSEESAPPPCHEQCKGDSADNGDDNDWSVSKEVELNLLNERAMTTIIPRKQKGTTSEKKESQKSILVHRFDSGVSENCELKLYLVPWDMDGVEDHQLTELSSKDFINFIDSGVKMWEECSGKKRKRIPKALHYYNVVTFPHFFNGLGPMASKISLAEKRLLELRHTNSSIHLNTYILEKGQSVLNCHLKATVSYDNLSLPFIMESEKQIYEALLAKYPSTPSNLNLTKFWMSDLYYQLSSVNNIRYKQRRIFEDMFVRNSYCRGRSETKDKISKTSHITLSRHNTDMGKLLNEDDIGSKENNNAVYEKEISGSICISKEEHFECRYYSYNLYDKNQFVNQKRMAGFQPILKFHIKITAMDFNSTTLAYQLTMIDRDLFLQIPVSELGLVFLKSHLKGKGYFYPSATFDNGTPCISTLISFSHRICCLVSSAILEGKSVKDRAKSIVHFINIAHKCFQLQNFQSCHSILFGLQTPAIFILNKTWKYIRRKHNNKYQILKHLCRFYENVQLTGYSCNSKNFRRLPFLPCITFILNSFQTIDDDIKMVKENYCCKFDAEINREQKAYSNIQINERVEDSERRKQLESQKRIESKRHVTKTHCSKVIRFLYGVFRNNKKQVNSQRRSCDALKTIPKQSPGSRINNNFKGKSIRFCWSDDTDETLKLFLRSEYKDWSCSEIPMKGYNSKSHQEVRDSHETLRESRMEVFKRTAESLVSSQYCAYNYSLPQSDLAKEYLLKAKYKDHHENFKLSLEVENYF